MGHFSECGIGEKEPVFLVAREDGTTQKLRGSCDNHLASGEHARYAKLELTENQLFSANQILEICKDKTQNGWSH